MNKYTCPECNGAGYTIEIQNLERPGEAQVLKMKIVCFFCDGTGFATEEDTFEEFYRGDV